MPNCHVRLHLTDPNLISIDLNFDLNFDLDWALVTSIDLTVANQMAVTTTETISCLE